ncbi:MAG: aldehyde dehydrogenase family protein [Vicinamibacterales bacterium]
MNATIDEPFTQQVASLNHRIASAVAHKDAWVRVGIRERIALLEQAINGMLAVADDWVAEACRAKRLRPDTPEAGEEYISGPMTTVRGIRLLIQALEEGGAPRPLSAVPGPAGNVVVHAFPRTWLEHLVYSGMRVDVWIQGGRPASQGAIYREKAQGRFPPGRVCCVLGAGNVSSIGPLDAFYKLIVEDQVVILKMNPVLDYLVPLLSKAFAGFMGRGVLQIVTGGPEIGDYLCSHPQVDTIHLTGSERTHDAIVWGATDEERVRRKAARSPRISKPMTSELGCVTPVMIVPDRWTDGDLRYHAANVASMVIHNASFNCTAAKVIVTARSWPQRETFLRYLEEYFSRVRPRFAYYPGAEERYRLFRAHYPHARSCGAAGQREIPWTILPDVAPDASEFALVNEAFCAVLAEVTLESADAESFMGDAVRFANDVVRGSLSCVVIARGATRRRHRAAFDAMLAGLRFGAIGVNVWTGANFALGEPSWGAFPGHAVDAIGSGIGVVHNAMLFDFPEKSIVYGPFRMLPKPVWFADHRTLHRLGRLATWFEARPSWAKLPLIALTGFRG